MTSIEDKIRELGRLAVGQLSHLERLNPLDPLEMQEFERNAALSTALIGELAADLRLTCDDPYDIFCAIIDYCQQTESPAADLLATCMPQIGAMRGRA